ncbi:coiled-coil domain-containing protein 201 [Myotis daubentonii]|uniref:coiled-coil domain-containing protein 201 n=1 Tax=Myotis daubentonii TaxID=98922 RepID=UPI00287335DB|nr:coiled-coil domain-containing protein 201 [Myotis daubentonii]
MPADLLDAESTRPGRTVRLPVLSLGLSSLPPGSHTAALFAQVFEWSSSEDEDPPSAWRAAGAFPKHSTPAEGFPGRSRSPRGPRPYRPGRGPGDGSPRPGRASRDPPPPVLRRQRLSTIWASEESSEQPGPEPSPQAPEGEPPVPTEVPRPRRPQPQRKAKPGEPPGSWRRGQGLPGISDTTGRRRRDLRKLAAVTERVRQWEARQLQSIEEAVQHDLTVQDE